MNVQNESSESLGVEAKSDPGNQQKEAETCKLALDTDKIMSASESSMSDQSGSDKVIKANIHDRYYPLKLLHANAIFFLLMSIQLTCLQDNKWFARL
jgi:hypothetical protein